MRKPGRLKNQLVLADDILNGATRGEADLVIMRDIVNFLGGWTACDKACLRAKRCASPTVHCFDLNREKMHALFEQLCDWPRFEGPRSSEDAAALYGEFFD